MTASPSKARCTTLATHLAFDQSPAVDLAFELQLLGNGRTGTSLFVYSWSIPTLVVGKGQIISDVNRDICEAEDIQILRRQSGGTAVLHNRTLNIGLILPVEHGWAHGIKGLYSAFLLVVSGALAQCGIAVSPVEGKRREGALQTAICFESHTEDTLLYHGKKVFGCAQRRLRNAILIHGTLVLAIDIPQQSRVFGVPEREIDRMMTALPGNPDPRALTSDIVEVMAATLGMAPGIATNRRN
jgi:lipoyl(octanoyl) transferase